MPRIAKFCSFFWKMFLGEDPQIPFQCTLIEIDYNKVVKKIALCCDIISPPPSTILYLATPLRPFFVEKSLCPLLFGAELHHCSIGVLTYNRKERGSATVSVNVVFFFFFFFFFLLGENFAKMLARPFTWGQFSRYFTYFLNPLSKRFNFPGEFFAKKVTSPKKTQKIPLSENLHVYSTCTIRCSLNKVCNEVPTAHRFDGSIKNYQARNIR